MKLKSTALLLFFLVLGCSLVAQASDILQMQSGFENGVLREFSELDTIQLLKVKLYKN